MDNKAMYKLTYGLFVLTAKDGDKDNGCIINTAIQAASSPNQISICVNKANCTHDMILKTNEFTVSVLSEDAEFDIFKHFGFSSGKDVNKFLDFTDCKRGENDIYYITKGTNAYISVKVDKTEDLGSHTMFIGEIVDMEVLSDSTSVTYEYYMNNIKPNPQKDNVSDISRTNNKVEFNSEDDDKVEDNKTEKNIWRCRICGYEYEGEHLPEDFICPICKHPASDFEKVN